MAGIIVAPKLSVLELIVMCSAVILLAIKKPNISFPYRWFSYLLLIFIVWLGVTSSWTIMPEGIAQKFLRLALLFIGGGFITIGFSVLRKVNRAEIKIGFVVGFLLGVGVICFATAYALITNSSLWGSYYFEPLSTLNNNAVVIALFSWAVLIIVANYSIKYAAMGFVIVLGILLSLPSLAATGALLIGALVLLSRKIGGRSVGVLFAAVAALLIVLAPNVIKISGATTYASPEGQWATSSIPPSARHRLAMWSFATEKIDEKPWLGWGFGASRHIPQEDRRLAPNMEIMPLHPHNLALQTRLELGLPGSLILAGLVFSVFYRLATFTNDGWVSGLAMAPAAGWLFVANVSYGMWQSWWIALAFLLAIFMKFALASRQRSVESPNTDL